jgi:hypothetical protein
MAAQILSREPDSPVARALRLWGDDESPFKRLMVGKSGQARVWRETIAILLRNLRADRSRRTVWRGWNFTSAAARSRLLGKIESAGVFTNRRVGMSASRSRRIASRGDFVNAYGALWEIRRPRSCRYLAPIFRAIGAKYANQREVVFPRGASFVIRRKPILKAIRQDGHRLKVWHYVFTEVP